MRRVMPRPAPTPDALPRREGTMSPRETPGSGPGICDRMRRDHQRVLADLNALENAASRADDARDGEMQALLAGFAREFARHMAAEDELLFPALIQALPGTAAQMRPLVA